MASWWVRTGPRPLPKVPRVSRFACYVAPRAGIPQPGALLSRGRCVVHAVWDAFQHHFKSHSTFQLAFQQTLGPPPPTTIRQTRFGATLRISFACALFFALMAALTKIMPPLHDQGWDIKALCFVALNIGLIWAPSTVFDDHGYAWFARIGAFIFLVLQQLILIDFSYVLNEKLKELAFPRGEVNDEWNTWLLLLLGVSALFFASALTGLVLLFVFYAKCPATATFISIALISIVVFTSLQIMSDPEHGHNLLVSSVVAAYVVYLTYIAVSSSPKSACNPYLSSTKHDGLAVILGLAVTFVSICGTVYFSSSAVSGVLDMRGSDDSPGAAHLVTSDVLSGGDGKPDEIESPSASPSVSRSSERLSTQGLSVDGGMVWRFNIAMMLIAMYFAMVLTDWGNPVGHGNDASPTAGNVAMFLNIVASWICILLYCWTLVAPRLFPDRDFS